MGDYPLVGQVVVIGAGGHAKVVIEALRWSGWTVIGCTDGDPTPRTILGVPVIGGDEVLPSVRASGVSHAFPAFGNNSLRERVGDQLLELGFEVPIAMGPNVNLSPSATVGRGVALFAGSTVNAEATLNDFVIINTGASVDHDSRIGRAAHIAPGCALAGCVTVGDRAFLGAGVSVIPGIDIGSDTVVGAGSVVVRDLPSGVTAMGAPARMR